MERGIILGDLFTTKCDWIVNTVNCIGVMGKGIALEFKKRYPNMFEAYKEICNKGLLEPGKLWTWRGEDKNILCFPTKDHWRYPSKIEWIEAGLIKFLQHYERLGITSIAFPLLGCTNGGLQEEIILPLMHNYLEQANVYYEIWKLK